MTSDAKAYGAIDEGLYPANYDAKGKSGSLKSNWTLNHRGKIRMMDGKENPYAKKQKFENGEGYKDGIFIHATNASGKATGKISVGCLLIAPNDFNKFNTIMRGVKNFTVQVSRKVTIKTPDPKHPGRTISHSYLKRD